MIHNEGTLRALAELIHHLRPEWDRPGIYAAIHANSARLELLPLVRAAVDLAGDDTAHTPAALNARDGGAWRTPAAKAPPALQPPPFSSIDLGRPNPDAAVHGAAATRASIRHRQEQP